MDNPKTWLPLPTVYEPGPYTVPASNSSPGPNETAPRRSCCAKDSLILKPSPSICTVYDILRHSAQKYNSSPALGSRKLIRTYDEVSKSTKQHAEGRSETVEKTWTYYEMGPYHFLTFKEYEKIALKCGSGLRKLGLEKGDRLHLFAGTTPCWLAMAHGAASQSLPIVTAYDTLGETGLQHSLCQTHAKTIFTDPHLLLNLINPLKAAVDVQYVIYNDTDGTRVLPENVEKLKNSHPRLTVLSFSKLQAIGDGNPYEPVPPDADDLCCIMYTSGSTGAPKGVLLKHKNVIAAVAGADAIVGKYIGPTDRLLTYLPLAHIFEFMFENASLFWGCTMGYGSPKTLSDRFVRSCAGDIREFRPTVMVGVPAVWETVKKGILSQISSSNVVARGVFWAALALKEKLLEAGLHAGVDWVDWLVFSKIKTATGGKLRICMNGGGPVAKGTQRFISMVVTPMIGGYGLTETCGMGAITDPAAWTDSSVGQMPACIEIKLVSVPELGYLTSATPCPQGEIWIRGGAVTEGYLDLPDENRDDFAGGWFKTGDIGEFDEEGRLSVIDRQKNLVKTLSGEYVALEKLETIYRSSPLLANICICALPSRHKPLAIVVIAPTALESLATTKDDPNLHNRLLSSLQQTGKTGGLAGIEIIDRLIIAEEEWTAQNGFTTSAQKLNRRAITGKYQKEIDEAAGGPK